MSPSPRIGTRVMPQKTGTFWIKMLTRWMTEESTSSGGRAFSGDTYSLSRKPARLAATSSTPEQKARLNALM
ncbi:hypothetical protein KCP73_12155 [Salmonella enterica subsp. enterica]|nr:hypothetical protein KCP73_12155 [Salmonella enterica subsp. enterica]